MTTFTDKHKEVLCIAKGMIRERDEELKKSTTINYNFLKELNIQRNERLITRLLKSILDFKIPTSEESPDHNTLLSSFIEEVLLVGDEDSIAKFSKLDKNKLRIELEHKIPSKTEDDLIYGQIDMVVHYELVSQDEDANKKEYLPLIAIEVKIDAGDQYGQCSRYIRYMDGLKAKRKEHFDFDKLVYLSPSGKKPTEYAFYDENSDNEIDDRLRVISKEFKVVKNWLVNIKQKYNEHLMEIPIESDGFIIALHSLIEIIEEWDQGESLMKNINKAINEENIVAAIEIAKALQKRFESQQEIFLIDVAKKLSDCYGRKEINTKVKYNDSKNKYFWDKSHHLVWEIDQEIYDEQLFIYLGTMGYGNTMYVGIMNDKYDGKDIKYESFKEKVKILNSGKYNSPDFIWWGDITVDRKNLSFDSSNWDILNSKSNPYSEYVKEAIAIINNIHNAFYQGK